MPNVKEYVSKGQMEGTTDQRADGSSYSESLLVMLGRIISAGSDKSVNLYCGIGKIGLVQ